jgi:S1-C subfamily serine protease
MKRRFVFALALALVASLSSEAFAQGQRRSRNDGSGKGKSAQAQSRKAGAHSVSEETDPEQAPFRLGAKVSFTRGQSGAKIVSTEAGGFAEQLDLKRGDILLKVNGVLLNSKADVAALNGQPQEEGDTVTALYERNGQLFETESGIEISHSAAYKGGKLNYINTKVRAVSSTDKGKEKKKARKRPAQASPRDRGTSPIRR